MASGHGASLPSSCGTFDIENELNHQMVNEEGEDFDTGYAAQQDLGEAFDDTEFQDMEDDYAQQQGHVRDGSATAEYQRQVANQVSSMGYDVPSPEPPSLHGAVNDLWPDDDDDDTAFGAYQRSTGQAIAYDLAASTGQAASSSGPAVVPNGVDVPRMSTPDNMDLSEPARRRPRSPGLPAEGGNTGSPSHTRTRTAALRPPTSSHAGDDDTVDAGAAPPSRVVPPVPPPPQFHRGMHGRPVPPVPPRFTDSQAMSMHTELGALRGLVPHNIKLESTVHFWEEKIESLVSELHAADSRSRNSEVELRAAVQQSQAFETRANFVPVSLTHLPLPTKRLV